MTNNIGSLRENSLHAELKKDLSEPGDEFELMVNGFVVDIFRDGEIIEIQTGSFSNIKRKLNILLDTHPIKLIYPLPVRRWIVRLDIESGRIISRRRSPKKGTVQEVFNHLVYLPELVNRSSFVFEVLGVEDEVYYIKDGRGSWRRKGWSVLDRKLITKVSIESFGCAADYAKFIPEDIKDPFSVRDLSSKSGVRIRLAQKMVYFLNKIGIIDRVGKRGNAWLYTSKHGK